jgi:hypothetical protein
MIHKNKAAVSGRDLRLQEKYLKTMDTTLRQLKILLDAYGSRR